MSLETPKVVVLGLDGVSWPLIQSLGPAGHIPRLWSLISNSAAGPMNSTWPEISPVAWTTFFTARSPGEHGIYGFTDFIPGQYQVRFNSSGDVRQPYVWEWLDLRGGRSVVLNVPLTYPARPLSGVMVSGFVALDYQRAAWPARVADYLRRSNYKLEADFERVHQDRPAFLADLDQALTGRMNLLEHFWPEPWDLFTLVVTDTDRLLHFFYREFLEQGPIVAYFIDFFRRVDRLVGRVLDLISGQDLGRETILVMLSDHGFAPVKEEFHVNRWLGANGFQPRVGPEALALALDPTRIYLNRPERFAGGRVGTSQGQEVIMKLRSGLMAEPAVQGVFLGREVYSGPLAGLAPDVIVHPRPGYEFKAKFTPGPIYTPSPLQGTHTYDQAFYAVTFFGPSRPVPDVRDILDLGRFTARLLGVQE